jgi:hypothetical protein
MPMTPEVLVDGDYCEAKVIEKQTNAQFQRQRKYQKSKLYNKESRYFDDEKMKNLFEIERNL